MDDLTDTDYMREYACTCDGIQAAEIESNRDDAREYACTCEGIRLHLCFVWSFVSFVITLTY